MSTKKKVFSVLVVALLLSSLLPIFATMPVQACHDQENPGISLDKTAVDSASAGDTITYYFTVTNSGNMPLSNVSVTDNMLSMDHSVGSLSAGGSSSFTHDYNIPTSATGSIVNTATAKGQYQHECQQYGWVEDSDNHTVRIKQEEPPPPEPGILLTKNGPASAMVCETITYNFSVTNNGEIALSNVTVNDAMLGGNIYGPVSLAVGETQNFSKTYTVKSSDPDSLFNEATATGHYGCGCGSKSVSSTANWTVIVQRANPAISIEKTGPESVSAGAAITYNFTVTNTGNVPLDNVVATDGKLNLHKDLGTMAPQQVETFQATYNTGPCETGPVHNTASVKGKYCCKWVEDSSSWTVEIIKPKPGIQITKSGPEFACVGDCVTYTFTVTNTGDIPLKNVMVTDARIGLVRCLKTLAVQETKTCTAKYKVKPWDPSLIVNTACVTACSDCGIVKDSSSHKMVVGKPAIDIEKCGPICACAGDTITYKFIVKNTGNVPLANVTVNDAKLGLTEDLGTLAPCQAVCFTADYQVKPEDACLLLNIATVEGTARCGTVKDRDCHKVLVKNPMIQIEKTGPETACRGDKICYKIKVTNTGNMPLFGVHVKDETLNWQESICMLCPGQSKYFKVKYIVGMEDPDPLVNTATVCACSICCGKVRAQDQHVVDILNPAVEIEKTGPETACVGDEVTYQFTVTNTGDVELTNLSVDDDVLGHIGTITSLGAGQSETLEATHTVTDEDPDPLVNVATVTVEAPCGEVLTDTDDHNLDILNPAVEIEKTGPETACVGDEVTYQFTVTNTGDVELNNLVVTDDVLGSIGTITSLGAGQSETLEATHTVTDEDPDPLVNVATVTVEAPCGEVLTDTDDHNLDILNPAVEIEKTGPEMACVGEEVTYQFTVTNTGDVELNNLVVTDNVIGEIGTIESLGAGESKTLEATYTITEEDDDPLVNVATVTVITPCQEEITDTDDHSLDVLNPAVQIVKTGEEYATVGDEVTYEFEVTNTGDTQLVNLVVTDDVLGDIGTIASLDAGESETLQATYTILESDYTDRNPLENVATVVAQTPCEEEVTDTDDHSLRILPKQEQGLGGIEVTKTLNDSDGTVSVGDTFTFDIQVTNTGETFIPANINLQDTYDTEYLSYKFAGPESDDNDDDGEIDWTDISDGAGLNPGESINVTVYFTALKAGEVDNNAMVTAADENQSVLEDSDSAQVTIEAEDYTAPTPDADEESLPLAQADTTSTTTTSSSLPYTGDSLGLLIIMAISMMAVGPLFIATDTFRRRKREK